MKNISKQIKTICIVTYFIFIVLLCTNLSNLMSLIILPMAIIMLLGSLICLCSSLSFETKKTKKELFLLTVSIISHFLIMGSFIYLYNLESISYTMMAILGALYCLIYANHFYLSIYNSIRITNSKNKITKFLANTILIIIFTLILVPLLSNDIELISIPLMTDIIFILFILSLIEKRKVSKKRKREKLSQQ
ncbi:MAG: hypothetical protein R3Y21_01140 [Mycoplasmatota bacterium]